MGIPYLNTLPVPGCPQHPEQFSRDCIDARCTAHWSVEGAPTPEEQLARWATGDAVCPNTRHECCPDFACCLPHLGWTIAKREAFVKAEQGTREKMMMGALGAAIADHGTTKVHITRGEPTDHE